MNKRLFSWVILLGAAFLGSGINLLKAEEGVSVQSAACVSCAESNQVLSYTAFRNSLACPWKSSLLSCYQRPIMVECVPQASPSDCGSCSMQMPVYVDQEVVYTVCVPQVETCQKVVTVMVPRRRWREETYTVCVPASEASQTTAPCASCAACGGTAPLPPQNVNGTRYVPYNLDSDYLPPSQNSFHHKAPAVILPYSPSYGLFGCSRRHSRNSMSNYNYPANNYPANNLGRSVPYASCQPASAQCVPACRSVPMVTETRVRRVPITVMVPEKRLQTYQMTKMVPTLQKEIIKVCQYQNEAVQGEAEKQGAAPDKTEAE